MKKSVVTPCLVAAAVGLLPASAPANPRLVAGSPAIVLSTAGLDLTTTTGRARLDRRIARAAALLCDPEPALRSQALDAARAECIAETVRAAGPARAAAIRADQLSRPKTAAALPR